MIIKSHIRGGYRAAADYLKDIGANEKTRLVAISDPDAKTLDEAFHNMWTVACNTKCKKPLHHISINPFKDERLTDAQVLKIIERAEQKYGYKPGEHQRVIVEHIKDGRQHFHVMWNRVSLKTGRAVWPGEHWKKSKQVAREMEKELGRKRPTPKRFKRMFTKNIYAGVMGYRRTGRTWKTGSRSYGGSKSYKTGGRHYRNNGGRYNYPRKSYLTKSTLRMSKVGGFTKSYPISSGRSGTVGIGINQAGFRLWNAGDPFLSRGINSFVKSPIRYPAWQPTSKNWIRPFQSGGSIRCWNLGGLGGTDTGRASFGFPVTVSRPVLPVVNLVGANQKTGRTGQPEQHNPAPLRPTATSGMSQAQLVDLNAAIEGKITWAEYYRKWGGGRGLNM